MSLWRRGFCEGSRRSRMFGELIDGSRRGTMSPGRGLLGCTLVGVALLLLHPIPAKCEVVTIGSRIIGGSLANITSIPYAVSIQRLVDGNFTHFCGGVLISLRHVLTAASCFTDPRYDETQMRVMAGTTNIKCENLTECGGQIMNVSLIIQHEMFAKPLPDDNDIAILVLSGSFMMSAGLQVATLRSAPTMANETCVASGWGITENPSYDGLLLQVPLPIYDRANCSAQYPDRVTANMFCAGYDSGDRGVCYGDVGGPLTCDGRVAGIVSFGLFCTVTNHPSVFTEVAKYIDWIEATQRDYQCRKDGSSLESRIFRGPLADIKDVPYQALIIQRENRYYLRCGATIITLNHVLTTATCVLEYKNATWIQRENLLVVAAVVEIPFGGVADFTSGIEEISVPNMFYSTDEVRYNIAVLTLSGVPDFFVETPSLKPIEFHRDAIEPCDKCLVSGWATGSDAGPPERLKWASVSILNQTACYGKLNLTANGTDLLCTYEGGPSTCAKDEGGPLVCANKLAGVILYGNDGCTKTNLPSLYIDVKPHLNWIDSIIDPVVNPNVTEYNCAMNGSLGRPQSRMVGGVHIDIEQAPHLVAIELRPPSGAHKCSGSIISPTHVLTTASCVTASGDPMPAQDLVVVAGVGNRFLDSPFQQRRFVQTVHVHQNYMTNRRMYNIAILELSQNFTWTATVRSISLQQRNTITCETCIVSGWKGTGVIDMSNLTWAQVPIFNHTVCEMLLNQNLAGEICTYAGGPGPCGIDEGGPLMCGPDLTGLVIRDNEDCASGSVPAVYLEVKTHLVWIDRVINPVVIPNVTDYQCTMNGTIINSRIIGSTDIDMRVAPYQVSIQMRSMGNVYHKCVGTVISKNFVLTTATCVIARGISPLPASDLLVFAGSGNLSAPMVVEQRRDVKAINVHANYTMNSNTYNLALLELDFELAMTSYVDVASLRRAPTITCEACQISGWRRTETGSVTNAIWAGVSIFNHSVCETILRTSLSGEVCTLAGGRGPCEYDEGGPLVCNQTLTGIATADNAACGNSTHPSIYVEVSQHLSWIDGVVNPQPNVTEYQCMQNGSIIHSRINGGNSVDITEAPYQVSVKLRAPNGAVHRCTGSAISMRHVLTTGTCVMANANTAYEPSQLVVFGGIGNYSQLSSTEQVRDPTKIHVHQNYTQDSRRFNIAIIEVSQNFTTATTMRAATLRKRATATCEACTVAGWQRTNDGSLSNMVRAAVTTFNHTACRAIRTDRGDLSGELCTYAGGPGPCRADEGGPLVCSGDLTGIAIRENDGCNVRAVPAVYVEVSEHVQWIEGILYSGSATASSLFALIVSLISVLLMLHSRE